MNSKRRRTQGEILEDTMAKVMKEQLTQELERETSELKQRLAAKEQEAASNLAASQILQQFIANGEAEMNEEGGVRLTPSKIRNLSNEDSFM